MKQSHITASVFNTKMTNNESEDTIALIRSIITTSSNVGFHPPISELRLNHALENMLRVLGKSGLLPVHKYKYVF